MNTPEKHLHIISLNVPYPADYGGVFDLFYKLPALQQQGVHIHLHCFEYGRGVQPELEKYCASVHYYPRQRGWRSVSLRYPYIVSSRISKSLLNRLLQDDYPIFMEGVHCTFPLHDKRFANRRCFVRLHNVEYIYYHHLAANATSLFKRLYYQWESNMLRKYERSIVDRATFWGVIEKDNEAYRKMGCKNIDFLPLFLPQWQMKADDRNGIYCLYQGDLSVAENERAVRWLITEVIEPAGMNLVVAGKKPSKQLTHLVESRTNTCLIANPSEAEMQDLIEKAQVNIIPSFNNTGIKIKLINALYNGKHCLVNDATVAGTGLEGLCTIANTERDFRDNVVYLFNKPFTPQTIEHRKQVLTNMFDNRRNARQMVKWIWGEEVVA